MLKDKLDIVIITYNRKNLLNKTLEQIFSENSPIRDFEITVLNNASDDGTKELVDEYCGKYSNLKHIINTKNIGGNANIAKALVEIPNKEYVWVLGDNDEYDWTSWEEVEDSINNSVDVILTRHSDDKLADIFYNATLVSGCIYKTDIINSTVIENIYDNIPNLFPHLAPIAYVINNKKSINIVTKDIVYPGINPGHDGSLTRGLDLADLNNNRKHIFWSVGYFNSLELIKNKQERYAIIDGLRHYHRSLFDLFKTVMVKNKVLYNNYKRNLGEIYSKLNWKQKVKFICAYCLINLSFKNYSFYEIRSKEQWKEYFRRVDEQKYLDKLAKRLKNKKVVLYGAGIISELLFENYDLSKLNIIGVCDKRFERTDESEFMGYRAIKPSELDAISYDSFLVTLKLFGEIKKSLKKSKVNKKMYSAIKKDIKYPIRT